MNDLLRDIGQAGPATQVILQSGADSLTRKSLQGKVETLAARLRDLNVRSVALFADNGIDWIVTDLACQIGGIRIIPIPLFFSASQIRHSVATSGVDALISDQQVTADTFDGISPADADQTGSTTKLYLLGAEKRAFVPVGTQKITFTSGTTGTPKGVCLSAKQQQLLAKTLASTIGRNSEKHLCVLPLSTLLENLAGVYAPLLSGATVIVPSLKDVGLTGSSQLDVEQLLGCIAQHEPNSLILVPEILRAITVATECGWRPPSSLHFVAVGGGKVAPELLHRAHQAGLPAFEGYGLSECASVVTLNTPESNRVGAVGRALPHVNVQIENGEIVVTGSSFLGYIGQPETWKSVPVRTGDIGQIDADGFVYVNGRAKNQLITSYGRNISPEWVESELLAGPLLSHAIVIGEARAFCTALVVAQQESTTDEEISAWIRTANQQLPDYAHVVDWQRMPAAAINKGGVDRAGIEIQHHPIIEQMYAINQEVSNQ